MSAVGLSFVVRAAVFPLTAVLSLANSSLVINHTGASTFAAISVAATLTQLLPFSDLGLGAGVLNAVSTSATGDHVRLSTVASAVRMLAVSCLALWGVALAGVTIFSWSELLEIDQANILGLDASVAVAIALFGVSVPLGIGQRILIGLSRNPLAIGLGVISPSVSLATTLAVTLGGMPIALLVLGPVCGSLTTAIAYWVIGARLLDFKLEYVLRRRQFHAGGLVGQGASYLVLSTASIVPFQLSRAILANRTGLDEVAEYALATQLYLPIWSFVTAAGVALWPIFAAERVNTRLVPARVYKVAGAFAAAAFAIALILPFAGPPFARLISHDSIRPNSWLFLSMGLLLISQTVQFVFGVALTSARDLRFQAAWAVLSAAASTVGLVYASTHLGASAPFVVLTLTILMFQTLPNVTRIYINGRGEETRSV